MFHLSSVSAYATYITLLVIFNVHGIQAQKTVSIRIDATSDRHAIDPRIYGVAHASTQQLQALNSPLNRNGGNNTSRYNWQLNADNRANDWFFQSIGEENATPGARGDEFVQRSRAGSSEPMLTIPIIDWVAKLGPNREKLASFSVQKYGAQQKTDQWMPDAGNGLKADGQPVIGNDPNDANRQNSPQFQQDWVKHLVQKWGTASKGGIKYFILDNEPGIWHSTHRDVQPQGVTMQGLRDKLVAYGTAVKAIDPDAKIVAPEEWGWTNYFLSGYDSQRGASVGWDRSKMPDRQKNGGMDIMPWLLKEMATHEKQTRKRLLDIFTLHIYPQGGEFGDDTSEAMQLRRNRSTRALWDPNYKDETWINDTVMLIPRMKNWVRENYPNTPIGITEYNWGAEAHINGATAQADILGIFGREGLDMAARWTTPDANTPTFKAMQMYRNYDGKQSTFGDTNVRCTVPNPDEVSAFAALRTKDNALTVMLINKQLQQSADVQLDIQNFGWIGPAQTWQLTAHNSIQRVADAKSQGQSTNLKLTVPAQSITMLILPSPRMDSILLRK
jgi:hypothetical protein